MHACTGEGRGGRGFVLHVIYSTEDLPNPEIEPGSLTLQADSLTPVPPGKPIYTINHLQFLGELFGQGV